MRLTREAYLRNLRGKRYLVVTGEGRRVALEVNESFALLWDKAKEKGDFSEEFLAETLAAEYGMTHAEALEESRNLILLWKRNNLLRED